MPGEIEIEVETLQNIGPERAADRIGIRKTAIRLDHQIGARGHNAADAELVDMDEAVEHAPVGGKEMQNSCVSGEGRARRRPFPTGSI